MYPYPPTPPPMDPMELYRIWAPGNALWTEWAKPVLFACPTSVSSRVPNIPQITWAPNAGYDTMIIVDLPGCSSVEEGLALAMLGFRPVPLYNGVCGSLPSYMMVDVNDLTAVLRGSTQILSGMSIRNDAPPAFLLDSNRMNGVGRQRSKYDNRWCIFPQDMPSAAYLIKQGVKYVIVRSNSIQEDLSHILLRYEEQGIEIYLCAGEEIKRTAVSKPSRFRSLAYRFKVITGLVRNAAGGFGSDIPDPLEAGYSHSGGHYRMG